MYRYFISFILLLSCMVLSCQAQGTTELGVSLTWQLKGGETGEKVFPSTALSALDGKGLWVAFKKDGEKSYPGIAVGGKFLPADVPLQEIASLELEVTVREDGTERFTERSVLFSDKRHFGSLEASPENVYHLLVLSDFVDPGALPSALGEGAAPVPEWKDPFFRTHRLAMNYAVQSDEKTHLVANGLEVKTHYKLPRLILVAEELIVFTVETEAQQGQSGGGLLGVDLEGMMDGEDEGSKKQEVVKIPTYSIDVMNDTIEAEGKYSAGFQNGRSLWNDILEGKVIYEASKGERQVVSATIVFSQMEKNIATRGSDNRILSIDATNTQELDTCEQLWPSVKADIAGFLKANPEWKVIIPQKPVRFYEDEKPLYDMYAWYRVHPQSGRMIGMLPDGTRGGRVGSTEWQKTFERGVSDGVNAAEKEKQEEKEKKEKEAQKDPYGQVEDIAKEKAQDAGKKVFEDKTGIPVPDQSAVMRYGQQLAGLYVASGGILEGVTMTFCDPTIAALGQEEWLEFLAKHALDYCEKFVEEHADMYDDYATMLAFWQGAVIIPCALSGEEACKYAAQKAIKGATKKAVKDAEEWIDEKTGMKRAKEIEEGIDAAKEVFGLDSQTSENK